MPKSILQIINAQTVKAKAVDFCQPSKGRRQGAVGWEI